MKIDIKTLIALATLLFAIAGFYYTTMSDVNYLSLEVKGLKTENRMQQKRLDSIDKKINRINKKLRGASQ
tara:strand:- start:1258 stop:1467 length:210 start_codon:yes stop_codon:yes gene_type:complete